FASSLDGLELVISVKIGNEGKMFESIGPQKIVEKLKETGFEVKKSQIIMSEPIKELGEYQVKVHLEHNLEPEIKIIVIEEKV
ncbi:MAG: 50S ribosomal protein L9, partial [Candidatus Nealsonbacteria bacterium]